MTDDFGARTLDAIAADDYREEAGPAPRLDNLAGALSILSVRGLERLETLLGSFAARAPLSGPAWVAQLEVIQALVADIHAHKTVLYYDDLHGGT